MKINQGAITFDGIDITKLSRQNLRNLFGMVLQNTWLFEGTVADNIAYGKKDASREEIIEAAKIAQCDHFIRTLPQGYDTIISSENGALSQGQQQLLTIARIILANPPVVILDEATSSVDTRTEAHIQKAMETVTENRTSFVIAHRLSTIENADLILVMKNGDIIEKERIRNYYKLRLFTPAYIIVNFKPLKRTGTSHSSFDSFQFFYCLNIEFPLLFDFC